MLNELDHPRKELALIVAMTKDRVIGDGNTIPWHEPDDLKFFKGMTDKHTVIMGRKTHDSLVGKTTLPNRRSIILSRDPAFRTGFGETANNLDAALKMAYETDDLPFIIGGCEIYCQALPRATVQFHTIVEGNHKGDTKFPEWDKSGWYASMHYQPTKNSRLTYITYERNKD